MSTLTYEFTPGEPTYKTLNGLRAYGSTEPGTPNAVRVHFLFTAVAKSKTGRVSKTTEYQAYARVVLNEEPVTLTSIKVSRCFGGSTSVSRDVYTYAEARLFEFAEAYITEGDGVAAIVLKAKLADLAETFRRESRGYGSPKELRQRLAAAEREEKEARDALVQFGQEHPEMLDAVNAALNPPEPEAESEDDE